MAFLKSTIVGSEMVYCSDACQAAGDDWQEEAMIAAGEEANEAVNIEFCKSEAMYDYDTIRKEAKLSSDSAGSAEDNKINPHSFKPIRNDSVYKSYIRGISMPYWSYTEAVLEL